MGPLGWIEIVCLFVFALLVLGSHFVFRRAFPNWMREPTGAEEKAVRTSLRRRLGRLHVYILQLVAGLAVAFIVCFIFARYLWSIAQQPLRALLPPGTKLVYTNPADPFAVNIELAMLFAVFLASPWILYQVWTFIAPALHAPECRWATRFVTCSSALFVLGGLVSYLFLLRHALTWVLLTDSILPPLISITDYISVFARVVLGVGILFELAVLVYFLAALRIVRAGLLLKGRLFIMPFFMFAAAIVTSTQDTMNLMSFFVPPCLFYYIGAFGGCATLFKSEGHKFRWRKLTPNLSLLFLDIFLAVFSCVMVDYVLIWRFHLEV